MYSSKASMSVAQYLHRLSGQEKVSSTVDHNYVKNWNSHPDAQRTKPARMLFMKTSLRRKRIDPYEEIDVVTPFQDVSSTFNNSPFNLEKSRNLFNELEFSLRSHPKVNCNRVERKDILKNTTPQQRRIYFNVMKVLNSEILALSCYSEKPNEIIKKRIATEKFAKRLKRVFANDFWDFDYIMWMHELILEELSFCYLVSYLRLLQVLRLEIPDLVDQIIKKHSGCLGYGFLCQILKKDCDPVLPVLNQVKPVKIEFFKKKVSNSPFLLISGVAFDDKSKDESSRMRFWTHQLNTFCKTIYVPLSEDENKPSSALDFVTFALYTLKQKVIQLKNHFPNRPIVLAGWTYGALIACHVALDMPVDAVICFGFPLLGVNGSRGDLDDPLLTSCKPILFIVGQNANMCSTDDIEDFRSRMMAETSLVVVAGADDFLRITPIKMQKECITQAMVDKCILDEIADFLQATLVKKPSSSNIKSKNTFYTCPTIWEENSSDLENTKKRKRRKSKEKMSTSNKRVKYSLPKKKQAIGKSGRSASSSETSSSGSLKRKKKPNKKTTKKKPQKRKVGRPPNNSRRRKPSKELMKPCIKPSNEPSKELMKPCIKPSNQPSKGLIKPCIKPSNQNAKKTSSIKQTLKQYIPIIPATSEKPIVSKPPVPFALNILPKKNDPVDVEKAFGKDSSFLPRPLTPTEEIKPLEEIGVSSTAPAAPIFTTKTIVTPVSRTIATCIQNNQLKKSFFILAEQPPIRPVVTTKAVSELKPSLKPVTSTVSRKKTTASRGKSSHFKTVFYDGKPNKSSNSVNYAKSLNCPKNISVSGNSRSISKPLIPTKMPAKKSKSIFGYPIAVSAPVCSNNDSKTVITSPCSTSANNTMVTVPARIVISSTTLKTPSGKIVRLLAKAPIAVKKSISSPQSGLLDQQACNLSMLSDVAGMTEPMKDKKKRIEPISSAATLVKLAAHEQSQHTKRMNSIRSLKSCSSLSKSESQEDIVEKQLAIQALNRNLCPETSTPPARSGYSICFTKPDGTIFTRAVPGAAPVHSPYIRQTPLTLEVGKKKSIFLTMDN